MLVDIKIKLTYLPQGQNSLILSPVAAIKCYSLEAQKVMWLLRTGLLAARDNYQEQQHKFEFIFNSQPLTNLELLKDGDTVEVKLVSLKEPSMSTKTAANNQKTN